MCIVFLIGEPSRNAFKKGEIFLFFFFWLLGRSLLMNDGDGEGRELLTRGCFLLAGIRPRVICNLLVRVEFSLYKG